MEREPYKLSLVDSHTHLEELDDLPNSLQEAKSAGICGIIAVGMDIESNRKVLQIAADDPNWFIRLLATIHGRLKKKRWRQIFLSFRIMSGKGWH